MYATLDWIDESADRLMSQLLQTVEWMGCLNINLKIQTFAWKSQGLNSIPAWRGTSKHLG